MSKFSIHPQERHVEVKIDGDCSPWDMLKVIHQLSRNDPHKEIPTVWILGPDFNLSIHSYMTFIMSILKFIGQRVKKGARTAVVAVNEFQRCKTDFFCAEASALPYKMKSFLSQKEAVEWVLEDVRESDPESPVPSENLSSF